LIFNKNIFDSNIFLTDETSSVTDTSVNEKKKGKSRGRSKSFLWRPVKKVRKVFIGFESYGHIDVRGFKVAPITESLKVESINLDDIDPELFMEEARNQIISAASKATDIKTVTKTLEVISMRPKGPGIATDDHSLVTMARELLESAKELIEKPSLYPGKEPSLYGDVPIVIYGEVEFQVDKRSHVPDECDDYDGNVYSYGPDGLEDGAPVPPLHPSCRCRLVDTKTGQPLHFPGSEWDTG
jgi:hypothetical protein